MMFKLFADLELYCHFGLLLVCGGVVKSLHSQFCETFTTLEMTQRWTVRNILKRPFLKCELHLTVCYLPCWTLNIVVIQVLV